MCHFNFLFLQWESADPRITRRQERNHWNSKAGEPKLSRYFARSKSESKSRRHNMLETPWGTEGVAMRQGWMVLGAVCITLIVIAIEVRSPASSVKAPSAYRVPSDRYHLPQALKSLKVSEKTPLHRQAEPLKTVAPATDVVQGLSFNECRLLRNYTPTVYNPVNMEYPNLKRTDGTPLFPLLDSELQNSRKASPGDTRPWDRVIWRAEQGLAVGVVVLGTPISVVCCMTLSNVDNRWVHDSWAPMQHVQCSSRVRRACRLRLGQTSGCVASAGLPEAQCSCDKLWPRIMEHWHVSSPHGPSSKAR